MLMHGGNQTNLIPMRVLDEGTMDGTMQICLAYGFPRERHELNTSGQPIYIGVHFDASATVTALDWTIFKKQYNSTGSLLQGQVLIGAWNNHTNLSWAFSST